MNIGVMLSSIVHEMMRFFQKIKLVITLNLSLIGLVGLSQAAPQDLIDGLGDESYQLREKSEQELALWAKQNGEKGLQELTDLKEESQSPEVKSRLGSVISGVVIYKAIPGTRGYMGIYMEPVMGSLRISRTIAGMPAARSGLMANDKIVKIDGIDLSKKNRHVAEAMTFVQSYVKSKKAGEKLTLEIERGGEKLNKTLKLADYDKQMAHLGQLDPFGNQQGGLRVIPLQGGGMRIIPGAQNQKRQLPAEMEKELLELNKRHRQRLLDSIKKKKLKLKELEDQLEDK